MSAQCLSIVPLYVNGRDAMDWAILKGQLIPLSFHFNHQLQVSTVQPTMYSRKVFLGGFPPQCSDLELLRVFGPFGKFTVSRPNPSSSLCSKNYCFLVFDQSNSVQEMLRSLEQADGGYYAYLWSGTRMSKIQVRAFNIFDAKFTTTTTRSVNLRFSVFVGGIARTSRAADLARAFRSFGDVAGVTIDLDPELLYPRGMARVFFNSMDGYVKAMRQRVVHVPSEDELKTYEIKPFILDSPCEECYSRTVVAVKAKHFCASASCLSYYCDGCWNDVHQSNGRRADHQPFNRTFQKSPFNSPQKQQFESPVKSMTASFNPQMPPPSLLSFHSSPLFFNSFR